MQVHRKSKVLKLRMLASFQKQHIVETLFGPLFGLSSIITGAGEKEPADAFQFPCPALITSLREMQPPGHSYVLHPHR